MRISELAGLTSLPLEQLGADVVDGDVVAALPVDVDRADRGSVLVATTRRLGVVGRHGDGVHEGLITLWAPWEMVSLETEGRERSDGADSATSHLVVRVGNRRFVATLEGAAGKAAVDDFALAATPRGSSVPSGMSGGGVARGRRGRRSRNVFRSTSSSGVAPTTRIDHDA